MKILITSSASEVGRILVEGLGEAHQVVATDFPGGAGGDVVACSLDADDATQALVAGVDAIVHVADLPVTAAQAFGRVDNAQVDFHSRCTYNLLKAAVGEGVEHVIYLSSLALFASCDPAWDVTERWAPQPSTDIDTLKHAIGEFTCREFARERQIKVTCLRIGELNRDDLIRAVFKALSSPPSEWEVYHLESDGDGRRFDISKAAGAGLFNGGRP